MKKEYSTVRVIILLAILGICFAVCCLINFGAAPSFYDSDMYCDYLYAMEAWEHKSIFPEGWVFGNQLNVVSTPVLAAVIYGLSGNMNFSMGAASTIMAVIMILCYDWMMHAVLKSKESRLLGIVFLVISVLYGGTAVSGRDGWSLLFTMCSYYAGYSITAFLGFGCYLRGLTGTFRKQTAVLLITCIASFGTGMQSIRQTTIMVAPILAVEFLRMLFANKAWKENKQPLWIALLISVSNLAGLVYVRMLDINQNQIFGTIALTAFTDLVREIEECILYLLIFVGSDYPETMIVIFGYGIIGAGALLLMLKNWKQERHTGKIALMLLLGFSVLIVVAIDIFTTIYGRPRYFFMIYPLLGFLVAYAYEYLKKPIRMGLMVLILVFFGSTAVREFPEVLISVMERRTEESYDISEYLLENGYTTVYALWEHGDDVAIASNGTIRVAYWHTQEESFTGMPYLFDRDIYQASPDSSVYFFKDQESADLGIALAESMGVSLELLRHFPESDTYIYKASSNLMRMNPALSSLFDGRK